VVDFVKILFYFLVYGENNPQEISCDRLVRGYWFAPAHPATGPGLLESLRFGLHRLYELRLDVDDDAIPISRASAHDHAPGCEGP